VEPGLVLILGMARRGEFESLRDRGLPCGILVDTNSKAKLGDVSGFALVERFDFSRARAELIEAVRQIRERHGLACLYNVNEYYVEQTADVAAALGLAGLSPQAARISLDKDLMRERFRRRIGQDVPARFHRVTSEADLLEAAARLGYPVFLQPTNVSASMWATRNEDPATLLERYRAMRREVPEYYARVGRKDKVLSVVVAEYLEGPNTSVDCLVDGAGRVYATPAVDVLTGRDVGIDDFHHFARLLPSRLSAAEQAELERLSAAGCQALDLTHAAAHVEFIGRRLGEIGARPGGNRPRILDMAYGIDMLFAYYQVLRGQAPDLRRRWNRAAAIITPFPRGVGTLREIRHLDRIPALPGYHYHEVRTPLGQAVGPSKSGFRAPLYVELLSEDADQVRRGVDEVASWDDLFLVE
jgi:cysteine synthase A